MAAASRHMFHPQARMIVLLPGDSRTNKDEKVQGTGADGPPLASSTAICPRKASLDACMFLAAFVQRHASIKRCCSAVFVEPAACLTRASEALALSP
eukprot:scaffold26460_cov27-Tisochrysis_lutea.AAC.4